MRRTAKHLRRIVRRNARRCGASAMHLQYSIVEASQALGVSPSTVYRRIKAGRYKTVELSDKTLRVLLPRIASQEKEIATQCEAVDSQCVASANHCEDLATQANSDVLATALVQMSNKLEAANFRIGYLEAQLEAERQQVKLLTDSQHKPSWLYRFRSWFGALHG